MSFVILGGIIGGYFIYNNSEYIAIKSLSYITNLQSIISNLTSNNAELVESDEIIEISGRKILKKIHSGKQYYIMINDQNQKDYKIETNVLNFNPIISLDLNVNDKKYDALFLNNFLVSGKLELTTINLNFWIEVLNKLDNKNITYNQGDKVLWAVMDSDLNTFENESLKIILNEQNKIKIE